MLPMNTKVGRQHTGIGRENIGGIKKQLNKLEKGEEMKIAVVSPNITNLGGISRCVIVLIDGLNKKGIIPDYYGVHSDKGEVNKLFNRKIEYTFKKLHWPKKAILYSAWMKNIQLLFKRYDYVFDFTNTLPWNKNKGRYFSYILYPEHLTSRGKYNKGFWRIYYLPHQMLAYLQKKQFNKDKIDMSCVSKTVEDLIYSFSGRRLSTLYPPANINDFKNQIKKKKGVVSLGGISHEKNQLEQIRVIEKIPNLSLTICGNSTRNPPYFETVKAASKGKKNIHLCPNLPFEELKKKLKTAEVFINSGRNDPFCMALIEGIAAGCLPLIHDSGGIVEIVPFIELRYKTEEEAVKKLKRVLALPKKKKDDLKLKLSKHIKQFGEEQFLMTLFKLIKKRNI